MTVRPRLVIESTPFDRLIELAGWTLLLATWILVARYFAELPRTIPIHFNLQGEADGYAGKMSIMFLPVLGTLLLVAMTILNRYPHVFNYPVAITEANAAYQYANAVRMIRVLKLSIALVFLLISWMTIHSARTGDSPGAWVIVVILAIVMLPLGYFLIKTLIQKTKGADR